MRALTCFFDTETAGLKWEHPIIQIAAIAVLDWKEVDRYERKIQFREADADPEALRINSYDAAVWEAEALPEREVVREFAGWLSQHSSLTRVSKRTGNPYSVARLAGHNAASFDGPRLRRLYETHERFLPADSYRVLDTLQLALWWFATTPDVEPPENFQLGTLCAAMGVDTGGAHDALSDVAMTVELARRLSP